MRAVVLFLSGAIMLGYLAIGFFFFRFWRKSKDSLFAVFAAAFWVLSIERVVLLVTQPADEIRPYVYLIRFSAFMLIIIGFFLKNRRRAPGLPPSGS
jgi:hypothetical protein